jgi:hypothetical protein
VFKSWTGACAGYGATCNLSLGTTDVSTTAVFASDRDADANPDTVPDTDGISHQDARPGIHACPDADAGPRPHSATDGTADAGARGQPGGRERPAFDRDARADR